LLAGIISRLPRLVFRPVLLAVPRLLSRLALRTILPIARLRVLTLLPMILAVRHLATSRCEKSEKHRIRHNSKREAYLSSRGRADTSVSRQGIVVPG